MYSAALGVVHVGGRSGLRSLKAIYAPSSIGCEVRMSNLPPRRGRLRPRRMEKHVALYGQSAPATKSQRSSTVESFVAAQQRVLDRYGVHASTRFVDVPSIDGRAQLIEVGDGPPLVMVIGGTIPAAMWAPLMARLYGYRLHAMDLPGFRPYRRGALRASYVPLHGGGLPGRATWTATGSGICI